MEEYYVSTRACMLESYVRNSGVSTGWRGWQHAKGPGPAGTFLEILIIYKYLLIVFLLMKILNVFCH
jgi:hypothetical protein